MRIVEINDALRRAVADRYGVDRADADLDSALAAPPRRRRDRHPRALARAARDPPRRGGDPRPDREAAGRLPGRRGSAGGGRPGARGHGGGRLRLPLPPRPDGHAAGDRRGPLRQAGRARGRRRAALPDVPAGVSRHVLRGSRDGRRGDPGRPDARPQRGRVAPRARSIAWSPTRPTGSWTASRSRTPSTSWPGTATSSRATA